MREGFFAESVVTGAAAAGAPKRPPAGAAAAGAPKRPVAGVAVRVSAGAGGAAHQGPERLRRGRERGKRGAVRRSGPADSVTQQITLHII